MKAKIIVVFHFLVTICFGQEDGWGNWMQDDCYKGIWVRVKQKEFNKGLNKWWWHVQFQNRYNQRVAFSWIQYDEADGDPEKTNSRHTFETNEIFEGSGIGGEDFVNYMIDDVCFSFKKEKQTWIEQCHIDYEQKGTASYAMCDEGTPRYSMSSGNSAGTGNNVPSNNAGNEDASSYTKLIVGKWKLVRSGGSDPEGKNLELFDEEYDCYDIFESNGSLRFSVGNCSMGEEESGTWSISGKTLSFSYSVYQGSYDIVKLDKTSMILQSYSETDNGYWQMVYFKE